MILKRIIVVLDETIELYIISSSHVRSERSTLLINKTPRLELCHHDQSPTFIIFLYQVVLLRRT